ncbi:MAG TPA: hypothetical protein RMH85_11280 [Polyangiaceae bacterium LLY-WYZ-15_(1-7)]|nr:hypothetical protein [Myxococcales bacterium]MAT25523.1 hypothetical protein [Sandaracinus sp.]HJK93288.1 hypothetical protein [Polyangiaceae bacterium LLY-WYZ-15_(1-7)]HJL05918.1 hypothetical protein [Polyangiaceae bacterium LLY-WYZ-15_(1-7)]HJL09077.1 hypothetical protein [Polyangiaceae bacterium LLY-WYZ-15_(1-7)]
MRRLSLSLPFVLGLSLVGGCIWVVEDEPVETEADVELGSAGGEVVRAGGASATASSDAAGDRAPSGGAHQVLVRITADDAWQGWADGEVLAVDHDWREVDELRFELGSGRHVLAFKAWDRARVAAGFIAAVWVDGERVATTGDGPFVVRRDPPEGFQDPSFDDADWADAQPCAGDAWNGEPQPLRGIGARWVWDGACESLGVVGVRLTMELP